MRLSRNRSLALLAVMIVTAAALLLVYTIVVDPDWHPKRIRGKGAWLVLLPFSPPRFLARHRIVDVRRPRSTGIDDENRPPRRPEDRLCHRAGRNYQYRAFLFPQGRLEIYRQHRDTQRPKSDECLGQAGTRPQSRRCRDISRDVEAAPVSGGPHSDPTGIGRSFNRPIRRHRASLQAGLGDPRLTGTAPASISH